MNNAELILALASHLRVTSAEVQQIVKTAPYRYKHYQIAKRSGGMRDIYHPTPELKAIQRWLINNVFSACAVSPAASAYEHGCSIRLNAERHISSNYFLKLDFNNFFPSIEIDWIKSFLQDALPNLEAGARVTVARLVCRSGVADKSLALSIGAPSSPALSNRILYDLDSAIEEIAAAGQAIYSRYADDMYLSTREAYVLKDVEQLVRDAISRITPKLSINEAKTLNLSRKRRISVTGLIVTPERRISLGRDLKRRIKTEVFLWQRGELSGDATDTLRGLITYAEGVETSFVTALERKFGTAAIRRLLKRD